MKLIESEAGLVVPVMSACISAREGRWFVLKINIIIIIIIIKNTTRRHKRGG